MMMITVFTHRRGTECDKYRRLCDITAFVLVIFRIAANSELRQKVLDLVLILTKKSYLQDCQLYMRLTDQLCFKA